MNKRIVLTLCTALGLVAAMSLATDGNAVGGRKPKKGNAVGETNAFAISTEYTGSISGDLVIDGVRYTLAKKTKVYFIGEGLRPQGAVVSHRSIYLAGEMRGDVAIVKSVIVRPATTGANDAGDGTDVRVGSNSDPR